MTQEQIKEQLIEYARNNANNKTILEAIIELLDGISNELYYDGFIYTSNKLTSCSLEIDSIVKEN